MILIFLMLIMEKFFNVWAALFSKFSSFLLTENDYQVEIMVINDIWVEIAKNNILLFSKEKRESRNKKKVQRKLSSCRENNFSNESNEDETLPAGQLVIFSSHPPSSPSCFVGKPSLPLLYILQFVLCTVGKLHPGADKSMSADVIFGIQFLMV